MGSNVEEMYLPPPEFEEDAKEPLFDINSSDSTELWLIQWPKNQNPDFHGQETTLKLHKDGNLGTVNTASGQEYQVLSFASQAPNATVFVSSPAGTKIVGKISRRVALVHYSEPHELEQQTASNLKKIYQQPSSVSMNSSATKHGARSWMRNSQPTSRRPSSTHSSRHKSSLSDAGEPIETPKKRHTAESGRSLDRSPRSSERGYSGVTESGTSDRSREGKSKKRMKPSE